MRPLLFATIVGLAVMAGCPRTPPKVATPAPKAEPSAPATPIVNYGDPGPRYRAQLKRLLAIAARTSGKYPDTIELTELQVVWKPGAMTESWASTGTINDAGALAPGHLLYLPPDAAGSPPQFWIKAQTPGSASPVLQNEVLSLVNDLAASDAELAASDPDFAALIADTNVAAEDLTQAFLIARKPEGLAVAASSDYALRALLEWLLNAQDGAWPGFRQPESMGGVHLVEVGAVQGLEAWWDPNDKWMLTRYTFPGIDRLTILIRFDQASDGRWISQASRAPADFHLTAHSIQIL